MSVKAESLEMKKMMVWIHTCKLEGGILHPLIFFLGNNHLVQGNDLKKKKTKKSKALTFDNTAERNDHNSESDGDKQNLHRLLNSEASS